MATDQSCFEVKPAKSEKMNISQNLMRGLIKGEVVND
jgi:hypothetical protein